MRPLLLIASLGLAACGGPVEPSADAGELFIAFQATFEGYQSWPSKAVDGHQQGSTHLAGPRTVYVNAMPAAGSTEFPVGTAIVKEMNDGSAQVFAMVKRGGNYNPTGALNWEWFELKSVGGTLRINWRGVGPPAGEMYGGDANGGCNGCHLSHADNDFVSSLPLDGGL